MARMTKEVLYLRREFTQDEKLDMGSKLAESHNLMADIGEEEAVMKSQIKERKSQVEATIGTLSRNLANGYQMENITCEILYDTPNVGELSFKRSDNGLIAKTRAMSESENQQEIDFHDKVITFGPVAVEDSQANIEAFFGEGTSTAFTPEVATASGASGTTIGLNQPFDAAPEELLVEDETAIFSVVEPDANLEAIKPEHDEAWDGIGEKPVKKQGRGRPAGAKNKPKAEAAEEEEVF